MTPSPIVQGDRLLGVPGEHLNGVMSARQFVNWYNGHPHFSQLRPALRAHDTAVVIGHGNVALDCARVLCKQPDELAATDIAQHALDALKGRCGACSAGEPRPAPDPSAASPVPWHGSSTRRVVVAGRRGHAQAAFTMKELREATRLPQCHCIVRGEELERGWTAASAAETAASRPRRRMDELLRTWHCCLSTMRPRCCVR